ncbi:MAG: HAD family hydrolase [Planctomycetaceae bacterium]|jgi:phosphoglycolate phosphatase|nr:HAD family hydrolase [Planctomycetaceae bacterium]MBT6156778.1 HAD family hydrolase [Planctomycetaceae bacterium]MBT6487733.1 HAD family hydrolase [Planctomycetaceae bacterium]MBT6494174.1 HAD family hydrolase [Planctomycetaceae bacterium]
MTSSNLNDIQQTDSNDGGSAFIQGTQVEITHTTSADSRPEFALFDFDGTLSLIREGWQQVMVPMMVTILADTETEESAQELGQVAEEFVMELNGKQTIYQMIRLSEEVAARGGAPEDPLVYKHRYHELLMQRVLSRRDALRDGSAAPTDWLVPGALDALAALRDRDVLMFLASGTDEQYVIEEAELLGVAEFFDGRIHGAVDDYRSFSKQMVIERILDENNVDGARLIGFGDGYVEIDNVKSAGGIAVAVASDESGRSGKADAWKRERLIGVGADVVIPDFREFDALCNHLWKGC